MEDDGCLLEAGTGRSAPEHVVVITELGTASRGA